MLNNKIRLFLFYFYLREKYGGEDKRLAFDLAIASGFVGHFVDVEMNIKNNDG